MPVSGDGESQEPQEQRDLFPGVLVVLSRGEQDINEFMPSLLDKKTSLFSFKIVKMPYY